MPVNIPRELPARATLESENVFVMSDDRAVHQDIRPLRIAIVNLMPTKIATETQLLRLLGSTPLQVEITLIAMGSHQSRNTPPEHLRAFYRSFEEIADQRFDGLVITGAPVERLPFTDVDYWPELTALLDWSRDNVWSSLYVCWGVQAALYHRYGIDKHEVPEKIFGVFEHRVLAPHAPLLSGFDDGFRAPHSRHTDVAVEDVAAVPGLQVLATSDEAGLYLAASEDGREVYVTGHPEYERDTLRAEYERDTAKGMVVPVPAHYFPGDDPAAEPLHTWRSHGYLLYANWLNHCVYQRTPYDLTTIPAASGQRRDPALTGAC